MYEDTVVSFSHPDRISIEDPLTQVLRSGARCLLAEAVEAEVEAFVAEHADLLDEAGRRRVVRHGCLSRNTALAMVFKLLLSARRKWRRLDGSNHLPEVIQGVTFKDGIKQIQHAA